MLKLASCMRCTICVLAFPLIIQDKGNLICCIDSSILRQRQRMAVPTLNYTCIWCSVPVYGIYTCIWCSVPVYGIYTCIWCSVPVYGIYTCIWCSVPVYGIYTCIWCSVPLMVSTPASGVEYLYGMISMANLANRSLQLISDKTGIHIIYTVPV